MTKCFRYNSSKRLTQKLLLKWFQTYLESTFYLGFSHECPCVSDIVLQNDLTRILLLKWIQTSLEASSLNSNQMFKNLLDIPASSSSFRFRFSLVKVFTQNGEVFYYICYSFSQILFGFFLIFLRHLFLSF